MAIDNHLLEGVGVGGAALEAGDIGDAQGELGSPGFEGELPIGVSDFPGDVSPLGIPGEEDDAGFGLRTGGGFELSLHRINGNRFGGRFGMSWFNGPGLNRSDNGRLSRLGRCGDADRILIKFCLEAADLQGVSVFITAHDQGTIHWIRDRLFRGFLAEGD
jgi:hypothetical protein